MRLLTCSLALFAGLLFCSWLVLHAGNRRLREQIHAIEAEDVPSVPLAPFRERILSAVIPGPRVAKEALEKPPPWGDDDAPVVVPATPRELGAALGELGRLAVALEHAESDSDGSGPTESEGAEIFGALFPVFPPLIAAAQIHAGAPATAEGSADFTGEALASLIEADDATAREIHRMVREAWDEAQSKGLLAPETDDPPEAESSRAAREAIAAAAAERLLPLVPEDYRELVAPLLEGAGVLEFPLARLRNLGMP